MLGRFLEISVHAPAIQASLEFYELLGFVQARAGETWAHPYAVVTDGRLFLGLHGDRRGDPQGIPLQLPAPTFVLPQLARGIGVLKEHGIEFDQERLGDEVFNHASFRDPAGQAVNLLEARTFSPPQFDGLLDAPRPAACGYFSEFAVPVRDVDAARAFWEPLGFVALEERAQPFARTTLTSDLLNLALYRTRAFRRPLLTFEDRDMHERLARLRGRGFELSDEMPDGLDAAANAVLIAPEGTRLLLMQSDE